MKRSYFWAVLIVGSLAFLGLGIWRISSNIEAKNTASRMIFRLFVDDLRTNGLEEGPDQTICESLEVVIRSKPWSDYQNPYDQNQPIFDWGDQCLVGDVILLQCAPASRVVKVTWCSYNAGESDIKKVDIP